MRDFSVTRGSAVLRGSEVGAGRAVVFLHAGVADRRSWTEVMTRLADDGPSLRCIAFDQRGYGDTTAPEEPHALVDDLVAVLDDRGVDRAVLVGCSRGGQLALDAALTVPDRVDALVLLGSAPHDAPGSDPSPELLARFAAIDAAEERDDLDEVNELEARLWLDGPDAPPGRVGGAARELFLDMNGRALGAPPTGERAPFAPAWDRLPQLDVPVAVLVGDLDLPGLRAAAEAAAARIPDATFEVVGGVAHLPMLERPELVVAAVSDVVARLAAQR